MHRIALKRYISLRQKTSLRRRKPINKISKKQRKELALRQKVRKELIEESDGICPSCSRPLTWSWLGFQLSHEKPLSRGGKTERNNLKLLCTFCHMNKRHRENIKLDA